MNESTLEKLKQEAWKKEVERKIEAFRRERIEIERAEHVQLVGTIYVELIVSHTPTTKETKVFEQEHKK